MRASLSLERLRGGLATAAAAALLVAAPAVAATDPQALEALQRTEDLLRAGTSIATYRMTVTRPEWTRHMRFSSHDDHPNERFRMEILEPPKTRGTLFFKVGSRLSMYLPKLQREIVISPVMMQDAWMGSDFNNQDLLEASTLLSAYEHRVAERVGTGPAAELRIESTPKADAGVVWGGLRQWVREDGIPLAVEYLDTRGGVVRRLEFSQVQELDGRRIPTRWVMRLPAKPGHSTAIEIEAIRFDAEIAEDLFQLPAGPR